MLDKNSTTQKEFNLILKKDLKISAFFQVIQVFDFYFLIKTSLLSNLFQFYNFFFLGLSEINLKYDETLNQKSTTSYIT